MQSNHTDPDAELLEKLKCGDFNMDTWGAFVSRVKGWVCANYPSLYFEAGEIATLAAETAYQRINTFRGESRFIRWVNQIAFRIAYRRIQNLQKAVTVSFEDLCHEIAEENDIDALLRQIDADEALRDLTDQERDVFLLRVLQDMDHKDIAARLGITHNACRQTWMRASAKLGSRRAESGW
jgi:RNA polymerase sigma factor (sigma-70 family)